MKRVKLKVEFVGANSIRPFSIALGEMGEGIVENSALQELEKGEEIDVRVTLAGDETQSPIGLVSRVGARV